MASQQGPGLLSLATIIKRLEAATSRLEDIAIAGGHSTSSSAPPPNHSPGPAHAAIASPPPPPPPPPPPAAVEVPPSVVAYDERIIEAHVTPWVALTKGLGFDALTEQALAIEKLYQSLRHILFAATSSKQPDSSVVFAGLLPDYNKVVEIKDKNRNRDWANHIIATAETVNAFNWLSIGPKPGPHIASVKDSAQFNWNRVITEFKDKDVKHVEWARAGAALLEEFRKYIMEFHTTGLVWNAKGGDFKSFSVPGAAAASSGGGAPPPPPPPPPATAAPVPAPAASGGTSAVFAQLNQGLDITKGLRKVDQSEMTHKNPSLRATSVVPAQATSPKPPHRPSKPTKPASLQGKKPTKFALEGNKWVIENYENDISLEVPNAEINHIIYVFGCKNITIKIAGKVNAVNLANCTKASILIDSVISSVEITRCPSFGLQITGKVPTINLDSTDSGQIYLSKECVEGNIEIFTAKCSAINVNLPVEGPEGDEFAEKAVPEMLRSTVVGGTLKTEIVEHSG